MAIWQVSAQGAISDGKWDGPHNSYHEVPDGVDGVNLLKAYLERAYDRLIMFSVDECGPMLQGSVMVGPRRIWLTAVPIRIHKVK